MYNSYANPDPRLRPYLERARWERAMFVRMSLRAALRTVAKPVGLAWKRFLLRREQRQALAELNALSDGTLKDIGISRSEINSVVNAWQGAISAATTIPHTYISDPDPRRMRRARRPVRKAEPGAQSALDELGYGAGIVLSSKRQRSAITQTGQSGRLALQT